ncbi:uncharacterized protein [Drosophila kikkawai]|uniref:Uncharacterized protein n=1 Tax=Drosophila kikkawai TaxID=30033 RepID=A0ABM4GQA0_DROKI
MNGQGHPPAPAPTQDNSWMYCAVDELLQAFHGAGPSQPRPGGSIAGPFRSRALSVDVTINADNIEEANSGNHARPRRPSTEGMPPLVPLLAGLIGPQRAPPEVVLRDDDEEAAHQGDDAGPHPATLRGMPLQAPLRAGHIGPQAPSPEVALPDDHNEEEVSPDDRFGPLRVDLTPPRPRDAPPGDRAPSADAEDAQNQAVSPPDDWFNFDHLVEDTLGELVDAFDTLDEAVLGLNQGGPSHGENPREEPQAVAALGPLGAAYDLVSDDEGRDNQTPRHYNPTGDDGDDSDATVLYDPTAEDSRDIRRRRTTPPHPSDNRAPPYMGEVEAALMECFGEIPVDVFDWGSGTNTASTISADEDEASRDGRQSDASRPPSTGPADDASTSTVSADEDETSQDSGWSYAPRSPPPRWTPPSPPPLQSWAPATASRSRPPPPSYEEIFGLRPYPGPHATARCAAVAASRDPRPRLSTIAELAAEEGRRRAEDLSEELGNPPGAQPPTNGPPPSPTPRRRARRRSAPWADSPPSSSDESSSDADEGAINPPRWVPAPVEWTTPNGTLPAALLRRIHGRLATPRRRTIRILEEEANQRFRVQINRSGKVIITLHPSRR